MQGGKEEEEEERRFLTPELAGGAVVPGAVQQHGAHAVEHDHVAVGAARKRRFWHFQSDLSFR